VQKCTISTDDIEEHKIMQISRHWRLNPQRYRLQGVRYENGEMSLQNRPAPATLREPVQHAQVDENNAKKALKAAS
jgi:hypothetical protein